MKMIFRSDLLVVRVILFACLFFCSYSTCLFAVDVEISKFDTVSANVSTNIIVTLEPYPVGGEEIYFYLRAIKGTGGAVFLPGGYTSINIPRPWLARSTNVSLLTLQIAGNQLSSLESNIVLEAKIGETVVAANVFTVVDPDMITRSQAIEIATAKIKGRVAIQEGAPIAVELKGRNYIVTFGYIRPDPKVAPGWRGPSFSAKVTLDAYTGAVRNGIQVGS